jgi:hypothetical protein
MVPSHSHVSASGRLFAAVPPNSTTRWRAASYASAVRHRCGGLAAGVRRVHVVPSHSQVSSKNEPLRPPNSTVRWRAAS